MAAEIKCPNCGQEIDLENVMSAELEQKYQKEYEIKLNTSLQAVEVEKEKLLEDQKVFEEKKKKENEIFIQKLAQEKQKITLELQESIRKDVAFDFENQVAILQQSAIQSEEKLKEARKKELEFLQKELNLKIKEEEMELTKQRELLEERGKLKEQIQKEEAAKSSLKEQENQLRTKELEKQLDDQKKLVEEMRRKSEQGSMQLQGEVLELALEELLKSEFQQDEIREVKKGEEGGDIIQQVFNELKKECGTIVWETKRAKNWSDKWIDKLKEDTQKGNADIAVLVTQTLPKNIERFGRKDGIWICSFADVKLIATILRDSLIKQYETTKILDNVSDKKETLYKYMTSNEFRQKWEAIVSTYMNMQKQLLKEKVRITKDWSERDKQLEIMLKNSMGFLGDVKGIGGLEISEIRLLEEGEDE